MTPGPTTPDSATPPSAERIRAAALHLFAAQGTAATSLRAIAASAGVSVGLVQHHFPTKAGLISAVDDYVRQVIGAAMTQPTAGRPADSVAEVGRRVAALIVEQPDVVNYLTHALVDGQPLGASIFDALVAAGAARWKRRSDRGETRPDLDHLWATLNPLILVFGTLILRPHLDRHLPESLGTPGQMQRWQESVNSLLREGQLRRTDNGGTACESSSDPG